jgi:hypothetical protein
MIIFRSTFFPAAFRLEGLRQVTERRCRKAAILKLLF